MKYKQFGLKPVGDDGTYYQNVPFTESGPDAARSYRAVTAGGLNSGDLVVTAGQLKLYPSLRVSIVDDVPAAAANDS